MEAPAAPVSSKDYLVNRERGYNSRAKSLIYGGDEDKPVTPLKAGKRSVTHKGSNATAPYAVYDAAPAEVKDHIVKPKSKEGAAKVGGDALTADVYRQQIETNYTNMMASKARNYNSDVFNGKGPGQ